ncbi:hypothetical protein ACQKND_16430 [Viridibacillus arvi]|uniref:hypothetical protein n=1 Tax=Viridibacillus arvi TaxID=263475 RepID=UPI003D03AB4E
MTIEQYLKLRDNGLSLEEIQDEQSLSEGTVWTLELGYQCYTRQIPLDQAISIIQQVTMINPNAVH